MTRIPRAQLLCSKVEEILIPKHFLRHQYLVSCLINLNRLPISSLTDLAPFSKLKATTTEITQACKNSPHLTIVTDPGSPYLLIPYRVNASALIIHKGCRIGTVFEIGEFVRMLIGGVRHCVYRTFESDDFAINFTDSKECMAVWRALEILPFKGHCLDVSIFSPQNSRNPPVLQPIIMPPMTVMMNHTAWKMAVQAKTMARPGEVRRVQSGRK
jgi:hypothetical protein